VRTEPIFFFFFFCFHALLFVLSLLFATVPLRVGNTLKENKSANSQQQQST
jgi:hypothetical protein